MRLKDGPVSGKSHSGTTAFARNSICPITALSLTTSTVSRDFILIFSVHERTCPTARESRLCGCLDHLCHPNQPGPFLLHRFGVAHQTSLRSRSTMMSYAISP